MRARDQLAPTIVGTFSLILIIMTAVGSAFRRTNPADAGDPTDCRPGDLT